MPIFSARVIRLIISSLSISRATPFFLSKELFEEADLNTGFGLRKGDWHFIQVALKLAIDIWHHGIDWLSM